jgi:UDP-N-acetylmuramoylalanine--D-glutamate ligase
LDHLDGIGTCWPGDVENPMSFSPTTFQGSRFLVLGLARSGLPVALALQRLGADVTAWDDSYDRRDAAIIAGLRVADPTTGFAADALVMSPGIPHRLPQPHPVAVRALAQGTPIISDVELLFRAVRQCGSRARFVGITGTNGKSTTTALLAHILAVAGIAVQAGGNLGTTALALDWLGDDGVYVLEMSSYMLERLATMRFDVAALLNLSPDHLDRHGTMDGYLAAKRAIFDRQGSEDCAIIGIDDPVTASVAENLLAATVTISGVGAADVGCIDGALTDRQGILLAMRDAVTLPGAHNAQNAAAAAAAAMRLGVDRASVVRGIMSFAGLAHRQQRVANIDGVDYINDSKATNADAASRALACYERLIWIAGGIAKSDGIAPLARFFPNIVEALLIGRDAPLLAETLRAHGVRYRMIGTLENAVTAARDAACTHHVPTVLLSPACASFDQFSGFDARGDRFADLVRGLQQAQAV